MQNIQFTLVSEVWIKTFKKFPEPKKQNWHRVDRASFFQASERSGRENLLWAGEPSFIPDTSLVDWIQYTNIYLVTHGLCLYWYSKLISHFHQCFQLYLLENCLEMDSLHLGPCWKKIHLLFQQVLSLNLASIWLWNQFPSWNIKVIFRAEYGLIFFWKNAIQENLKC